MHGPVNERYLLYGGLAVVFVTAFLASFFVTGGADASPGTVDTALGTFEASFFKIDNSEEVWMGFTTPVEPGTSRMVAEPVIPIAGTEDWPTWRYRANSDGIRDDEVPAEKPANTTRILVLGNSLAMGNFVNESARFTERLQDRLNAASGGRRYRVINAGVPSAGMFDFFVFLQTIGIRYDPDIVLVHFERRSDISRAEHLKRMNTLYRRGPEQAARQADLAVEEAYMEQVTWNTSETRIYGRWIARFSHRHNITPVLLPATTTSRMELYRRWADRINASIIPPPPGHNRSRHRFADNHYTPDGHRWLAAHLHEQLKPVLGDIRG